MMSGPSFDVAELVGVVPALISPLQGDGRIDEEGVGRLVEHVIDGGVRGLLALGSTGETASLDEKARRAMLSSTVAAAAGRVPVICGVAQSHLAAARAEEEAAAPRECCPADTCRGAPETCASRMT